MKKGYIGIATVLLLSIVGSAMVMYALRNSIEQSQRSLHNMENIQLSFLIKGCGETAMGKLVDNYTWTGTGEYTSNGGNCTYTVSGSQFPKTIHLTAILGNSIQKNIITVADTGITWQEE